MSLELPRKGEEYMLGEKKAVSGVSESRLESRASRKHLLPDLLRVLRKKKVDMEPEDIACRPNAEMEGHGHGGGSRGNSQGDCQGLLLRQGFAAACRFSGGAMPATKYRPDFGAGCRHIVFP